MTFGRGTMQSDYMHWFKVQKPVRYSLSSSDVTHFRLDRLPLTIADLDLDGASHFRFTPLRRAIGERYGVAHGDTTDGVEDHINLFKSPGLEQDRTEIAYNRLRGGHKHSKSGSGINVGDLGGGNHPRADPGRTCRFQS